MRIAVEWGLVERGVTRVVPVEEVGGSASTGGNP
jgi:hypothetical protein